MSQTAARRRFLLATGYEQVRSIVAAIVGDLEATARVQLSLLETEVCTTRPIASKALGLAALVVAEASCCGPTRKEFEPLATATGAASSARRGSAATPVPAAPPEMKKACSCCGSVG